ncbi:hypothetical protein B0H14DRAFT_2384772, partial [Mycena olivaceomarginata]
ETIAASQTAEEATAALYGSVRSPGGKQIVVHVASLCRNGGRIDARATFGLYWGPLSRHNLCWRIPGRQTDGRGIFMGILCALASTPPTQQIDICSTSKYAIRAICYRAGISYTEGWSCANGDLLQLIVAEIQQREEQVRFCWVDKPANNLAHLGARNLAQKAAATDYPFVYTLPDAGSVTLATLSLTALLRKLLPACQQKMHPSLDPSSKSLQSS